MNAGFRRLLALIVVFAAAFVAVLALRHWRAGGTWKDFIGGKGASGEFRPEKFTLADKAPLETDDVELLSRLNGEYARLTKAVTPSVVSIGTEGVRTEKMLDNFGHARIRQYPTQGQGSGVIVSREGHVVTNHHVIAGQQQIQITLHDGKTYPATLIGEDALLDIAVLKLEGAGEVLPLKFGDSSQVEVGQLVFAVGNPFGLGETVTQGIISAKERSISDNQRDLFQTDAAINPGNSGGPLVNLRGEIIGINAAIFSSDRTNPGFQGVGFSIPSNDVKDAISQILERGRPIRGFLGVQMADLDGRIRGLLDYSGKDGAVVGAVTPGSPAETAGLQPKDVVQSYNGEAIHSMNQLFALVQRSRANQEVPMGVWRAGQTLTLKAVIAESGLGTAAPVQTPPVVQGRTRDTEEVLQALGIQVRDLSVPERMRGFRGVVVTDLVADALAADRLKAGDLVVGVNRARIGSANEFYMNLAASAAVQTTAVYLVRDGKQLRVDLPALPRDDSSTPSAPSGR
ncbi:MAG: trypsin-like peptidase domain-containing protein [Luteolibacter sp.]